MQGAEEGVEVEAVMSEDLVSDSPESSSSSSLPFRVF